MTDKGIEKVREEIAAEIQFLFQCKRPPSWSNGVKDMRLEQADSIILKLQQAGWKPPEEIEKMFNPDYLNVKNMESAIRADQNKKIGDWLESESLYETSSGYLVSNEIIAKLQKGDSPE